MSFWSTLFGSGNVVNKAVDGIYNGVDKLVYTDEEKADDFRERVGLKIKLLQAYEPFKLAQRFLALLTGIPFVLIHIVISVAWMISIFVTGPGLEYKFIFEQLKLVSEWNNATLGEPFGYIVIFYFLGGAAEGGIRAFGNRKKSD